MDLFNEYLCLVDGSHDILKETTPPGSLIKIFFFFLKWSIWITLLFLQRLCVYYYRFYVSINA